MTDEHRDEAELVGFLSIGDARMRPMLDGQHPIRVLRGDEAESYHGDYTPFVSYEPLPDQGERPAASFVLVEDGNGWRIISDAPENRLVDVWAGGQRFPDHFRRGARWFDRKGTELFMPPSHYRLPPGPPARGW